jgi:hypothetical protein
MNKATQWLADPERTYADGLRLYTEVFGTDKQYDFFAGVSSPDKGSLHFNLLEEKIRKAARMLPEETEMSATEVKKSIRVKNTKPSYSNPDHIRVVDNPLVEVTSLPEELQQKYFENKSLTLELAAEHASMKDASSDAQRAVHLENLKRIEKQRDENWQAIDSWWKANKPGVNPKPAAETNESKRRETLRKAIHRAEQEIASGKLDEKKTLARNEKLAAWKKELEDLKK